MHLASVQREESSVPGRPEVQGRKGQLVLVLFMTD